MPGLGWGAELVMGGVLMATADRLENRPRLLGLGAAKCKEKIDIRNW
jgi:hypothetical protein